VAATRPIVAVFGASSCRPGDGLWEEGETCGRLLAEAGYTVSTGGYGGLMEAVSRGANAAGGRVIGVTVPPVFPDRTGANAYVTEEIRADTLTERIHEMTRVASAVIALHGSIGTLTELIVAWNLAFVARFNGTDPLPVIAVGERWRSVVADLTAILDTEGGLVECVPTAVEAVAAVRRRVPAPGGSDVPR
jgi:uncharacterized protein (TIGR00730 family)